MRRPTTTVAQAPSKPVQPERGPTSVLCDAVVQALAYADLFDWPLSAAEVHRFLPVSAGYAEAASALQQCCREQAVREVDGMYSLPGREALVGGRRAREAASATLWPRALRVCRLLATMPWVRLVAVSGSLAVGAAQDGADVDLLLVTADGRLWLTRALTIVLGRSAARGTGAADTWICPNYLLAATALALPERDLFTAHELVQLVPVFGPDAYRALLDANTWYRGFLPNHPGYRGPVAGLRHARLRRAIEPMLRSRLVSRMERWEMDRKIARLSTACTADEVRFDATVCKGHFDGYRRRTLQRLGAPALAAEVPAS